MNFLMMILTIATECGVGPVCSRVRLVLWNDIIFTLLWWLINAILSKHIFRLVKAISKWQKPNYEAETPAQHNPVVAEERWLPR